MRKMLNLVKCFSKKEGGSSVELGLLVALIAAAVVGAVTYMGSSVKDTFNSVAQTVNGNDQPPEEPHDDEGQGHHHH
jgi:pilus assembly protein Flp/PilA